eukprot:1429995-Rhodomonas_salina.2
MAGADLGNPATRTRQIQMTMAWIPKWSRRRLVCTSYQSAMSCPVLTYTMLRAGGAQCAGARY